MRSLILLALVSTACAQQTFEVASVKAVDPSVRRGIDFRLSPGGRLTATNVTLRLMIMQAYGVKRYQMTGGPAWLNDFRFDITAKAEGDPPREQMLKMLATLLERRFNLKVRRESKEGTVYNLVIAKAGSRLAVPGDATKPARVSTFRTGDDHADAVTYVLQGVNAPMTLLIENLAGNLERPVFDRTGLAGSFDFRLEFASDDAHTDTAESIFSAIEKQLGLKLESAKGPVETLVIDHAEKPSEN